MSVSPRSRIERARRATFLAVVALTFVVAAWSERPAKAVVPGANGKIVFVSDRDGNAEIYVMKRDGTGQTRLTNSAGLDFDPAWSPDGTQIAFTSTRDGNIEIYVMKADGTNQTRLTNNPALDQEPDWGVARLTPAGMIEDLSELVGSYNLPHGIENALRVKLNAALWALAGGDAAAARDSLRAFLNQVEAQRGKKLTAQQADALVEAAEVILAAIR